MRSPSKLTCSQDKPLIGLAFILRQRFRLLAINFRLWISWTQCQREDGSMANKRSVARRRADGSIEARRSNLGDMAQKQINRIANAVYSNFLAERADEVFFIRSLDF